MMHPAPDRLPDGNYPFIDREYSLADMIMAEAPPELEQLIRQQAEATGLEIIRDVPVELSCVTGADVIARFLVWWPQGSERLHILTPARLVRGRA